MSAPAPVRSVPRRRSTRPTSRRRARSASSRSSRPAPTAAPRSTSTRSSPGSTRRATTCRSCRCRRGAPSASSSGPASRVLVIDEPDDAIAVGALAAHLAEVRADVVHAHMYRAETVGDARGRSPSARPASAGRTSSRRSTRAASGRRRTGSAARADAAHRPAHRGLAGDRGASSIDEGRDDRPGPAHLQRRRPPALRPPGAVLHAARGVRHGARARRSSASSPGSSRRRATRPCSRPGRACCAPSRTPTC